VVVSRGVEIERNQKIDKGICPLCLSKEDFFFVVKGPAADATDAPQP
jgi:hypothetical protein